MGERKLTEGSVTGALIAFTIPLVLSGMFQQLFSWVDAFIVGNYNGELALAGIGSTTSIYNLFVTVITGFTSGLSVLAAQKYGRGERKGIRSILCSCTALLGLIFLVIAVLGITFRRGLLSVMDTPENILTFAEDYLGIVLMGVPLLAVYNTFSAILRGMGNSRAPFLSVLVSSIANVVLDMIFVMVFGWGVKGAAAATVIAQAAMTFFAIFYTRLKYPELRGRKGERTEVRGTVSETALFGLPPAVQSGVSSAGNVILQQFMNGFGEQTVAAITTAYRVDTIILLPIINLGSGIATVAAQNIGAGKPERVRRILRTGLVVMSVVSVILTLIVFLFGAWLISIFGLTPSTVDIGRSFFNAIASFYIVFGLAMALRGYVEGHGDMLFSGLAGIASLVVRIIMSYVFRDSMGNMAVAYAEAVAWIFLLSEYVIRYAVKYRKR